MNRKISKDAFVLVVGVYLALTTYSSSAGDVKTLSPIKTPGISKTTSAEKQVKNNLKITTSVDAPTLKAQPLIPASTTQKMPIKDTNKKVVSKQPGQSGLNYVPLKKETIERVPTNTPQWSDQRTSDPGKSLLNPQYSNEKFGKSTKGDLATARQPVSGKQTNRGYSIRMQPDNNSSVQFGNGKIGSRPPTTKNTQIPVYKATTRSSTIDTTRGFNSQQNSTPQVDVKSTGKLVTTGFVRKPVATVTSNTSGKQFSTKPRLITANRLIVKAHITNRRIRSQPLIVKGL